MLHHKNRQALPGRRKAFAMPTALFCVTDKRGLSHLAARLAEAGWTLLATGETTTQLRLAGLSTLEMDEHAGAREMLGIDLLVANLSPFEERGENSIDLEAVALLRAGARSFEQVTVLCDPTDYLRVIGALPRTDLQTRRELAAKAFALTSRYDAAISEFLAPLVSPPAPGSSSSLRCGENPQQRAHLLATGGPLGGRLIHGRELSYNNLLDGDAAWRAVQRFDAPAVSVVKHAALSGLATALHPADALLAAVECDRTSAYGAVVACNHPLDRDFVVALGELFIKVLLAPAFEPEARQLLVTRPNLRLLELESAEPNSGAGEFRSIRGGLLWQERDEGDLREQEWQFVTRRAPSPVELEALRFAWKASQQVRSGAIVLARGTTSVGIGAGQPSRIGALRLAIQQAGQRCSGAVLASDGHIVSPDLLELAATSGVTAVIQPGALSSDEAMIAAADRGNLAMILTGRRHLRH